MFTGGIRDWGVELALSSLRACEKSWLAPDLLIEDGGWTGGGD